VTAPMAEHRTPASTTCNRLRTIAARHVTWSERPAPTLPAIQHLIAFAQGTACLFTRHSTKVVVALWCQQDDTRSVRSARSSQHRGSLSGISAGCDAVSAHDVAEFAHTHSTCAAHVRSPGSPADRQMTRIFKSINIASTKCGTLGA
jgi:hypothetical protein